MFAESIDPDTCAQLRRTLDQVGQKHVYSMIASKSGHTTETLALFAMLLEWYSQTLEPEAIRERAVCLTEAGPSPLRALAQARGLPILEVPADVWGAGSRRSRYPGSCRPPLVHTGRGRADPMSSGRRQSRPGARVSP